MKYAMVVLHDKEEYRPLNPDQFDFEQTAGWWAGLKGKIAASARRRPRQDCCVARRAADRTDGPYVEAKETVGGIVVVEVNSIDEAVALAKTFPNKVGVRIEVRPVLEP